VQICLTGGTISQRASQSGDTMERVDLSQFLPSQSPAGTRLEFSLFSRYSGASLRWKTIFQVRQFILTGWALEKGAGETEGQNVGFVVVTGTDALEEFAFALDLLLPAKIPVVVTGAAKPTDADGFDGIGEESTCNLFFGCLSEVLLILLHPHLQPISMTP